MVGLPRRHGCVADLHPCQIGTGLPGARREHEGTGVDAHAPSVRSGADQLERPGVGIADRCVGPPAQVRDRPTLAAPSDATAWASSASNAAASSSRTGPPGWRSSSSPVGLSSRAPNGDWLSASGQKALRVAVRADRAGPQVPRPDRGGGVDGIRPAPDQPAEGSGCDGAREHPDPGRTEADDKRTARGVAALGHPSARREHPCSPFPLGRHASPPRRRASGTTMALPMSGHVGTAS